MKLKEMAGRIDLDRQPSFGEVDLNLLRASLSNADFSFVPAGRR